MFGTQVLTDWDLFQLLKVKDPPVGTDWLLSTDYLSERGFGLGTTFDYEQNSFLGHPGPVVGWFDAWGIRDTGIDDLGRESAVRDTGHASGVAASTGGTDRICPTAGNSPPSWDSISDRNFLEQYFEKEWDEWKDRVTSLELKRTWEDQSLRILGQVRLNDSVSQTEWFPRLDHFLIGRSLLQDRFTWYAHSQASYARFQILDPPTDPQDATGWQYLPWEQPDQSPEGGRVATRQEIDLPFQFGCGQIRSLCGGRTGLLAGESSTAKEMCRVPSGRRECG